MADTHHTPDHHAAHHVAGAGMHKKLGPLEVWQWVAVGALIGVALYLRNRNTTASTASASLPSDAATSSYDAGYTAGQSAVQGAGGGGFTGGDGTTSADGTTGASSSPSLGQELSDLGSIESLMSGFGQLPAADTGTTTGTGNPPNDAQINKTLRSINRQLGQLNKRRTTTRPGGNRNPGHTVTRHHDGKETSSSTHHKAGQRSTHKTVAPPSHQHHTSPTTRRQPMRHTAPRRHGP